jgi:hypothetical protein
MDRTTCFEMEGAQAKFSLAVEIVHIVAHLANRPSPREARAIASSVAELPQLSPSQ